MLFALPACTHAGGHYEGPVYTHTVTVTDAEGSHTLVPDEDCPNDESLYGTFCAYNGGIGYSGDIGENISFNVMATFTWTADAVTPSAQPPDKTYFLESGSADAGDFFFCDGGSPEPPTADNGLDDDGNLDTDDESPFLIGYDCTSNGSHLQQKSGATITFTHSLSAILVGDYIAGSGNVFYKVVPTAALTLPGTTEDSDGKANILIGQGCSGALGGGGGLTFSNYQWNVDGETFANFEMGTSPGSWLSPGKPYGKVNYVDPSEWSQPSPHWYWKKGADFGDEKTVSVTADASVGGVSVGSVSQDKKVKVWKPYHEFRASAGNVSVAGDDSVEGTIVFYGAVGTPDLFRTSLGSCGTWQATQLCDIERTAETYIGWPQNTSTDGLVLDAEFNYASSQQNASNPAPWPADSTADVPDEKQWADAPEAGVGSCVSAVCADTFNTYMMYLPPGDAQWVPLHRCIWNWQVNMSRTWSPSITGYIWGAWLPDPAGTVNVAGDDPTSTFPSWTDVYNP